MGYWVNTERTQKQKKKKQRWKEIWLLGSFLFLCFQLLPSYLALESHLVFQGEVFLGEWTSFTWFHFSLWLWAEGEITNRQVLEYKGIFELSLAFSVWREGSYKACISLSHYEVTFPRSCRQTLPHKDHRRYGSLSPVSMLFRAKDIGDVNITTGSNLTLHSLIVLDSDALIPEPQFSVHHN